MPDKATEAENTNSAMSKAMGNVPPRDESVSSMRFKMGGIPPRRRWTPARGAHEQGCNSEHSTKDI